MTRFIIVSFFPTELNEFINPIREHFEKGASLIVPPHISLIFPFFLKDNFSFEQLTEQLSHAAKTVTPIAAVITGVSTFEKEKNKKVIYLKVSEEKKFKSLNKILLGEIVSYITIDKSIFPKSQMPSYIPHVTLAIDGKSEDLEYAKSQTENLINKDFTVDKFFLLSNKTAGEMWRAERVYALNF